MTAPATNLRDWLRAPRTAPARPLRDRLELALGVVVTALTVLALSRPIQPAPKKLDPWSTSMELANVDVRLAVKRAQEDAWQRPRVAPEFVSAVTKGDLAAMKRLYVDGMPLDGMLGIAAGNGRADLVRWLLDHHADVHEQEWTPRAPLLVADAHPDVVALLLERGATEATLAAASEGGAPNAVDRLLAAHADPNPADANPVALALASPYATSDVKRRIVDALFAAGADASRIVASPGGDVLAAGVIACTSPDLSLPDCLALLASLEKRGAMATGDAIGGALANLETTTREPILRAVLAAKILPGATASALAGANDAAPASVKLVVARGVDWNYRDGESDAASPLVSAIQRGERENVRIFLEAGAPADRHTKNGSSPLGEAIDGLARGGGEYANIVEMLVARGADPNRRLPDGRSPLFAAAEAGDTRAIAFLLDHGARVNELVLDDTALDAAEAHGNMPAARVIHARGGHRARKPYPL